MTGLIAVVAFGTGTVHSLVLMKFAAPLVLDWTIQTVTRNILATDPSFILNCLYDNASIISMTDRSFKVFCKL